MSVFTAARDIGDRIGTAYRSLERQSYQNWEWVVVDDSLAGATAEHLIRFADLDPYCRVRLYRQHPQSGSIGANKGAAAGACHGEFLVELDHDDELLPEALELIAATFVAHPEIDFVYSDWIEWEHGPNGGVPVTYPSGWGLGFGAYASELVGGRRVPVALTPPLTSETLRHIVAVPNHVRAWRAHSYRRIGGHDWRLPVADDYELILRTFLNGYAARIPRPLYVQHHDSRGGNAAHRRNAEIQRRVEEVAIHYKDAVDRRCTSLGVTTSSPSPLTGWEAIPRANAVVDVVAEAAADSANPLVSVVVPTYSRGEPLERAIASILAQTYENVEVLVVGDNCPRVEGVVNTFADDRLRHWNLSVHHGDAGASPRNYALKTMARGTLVAYLDDDNVWREDHLESLVRLLVSDPSCAFAFASLEIRNETILCRRPRRMQIDTSALVHRRLLLERFGYWRRPQDTVHGWAHDWELVSRWIHEPWRASLEPTVSYTVEQSARGTELIEVLKSVAAEESRAALNHSSERAVT